MAKLSNVDFFLKTLQEAGGSLSNPMLKARLEWDEIKYETIRETLCEQGLIARGRGMGGTVRLLEKQQKPDLDEDPVIAQSNLPSDTIQEVNIGITAEQALYGPMQEALTKEWKRKSSLEDFHIERTANLGSKNTGGNWSRPDLIVLGTKKYEFLRDRVFELHTFEIKPSNDVTIKGVLEALSHREAATRSYVVYHTGGEDFRVFPEHSRIAQLAARHGVGVFAAKNPSELSEWVEIVAAQRADPDLDSLEAFIRSALSDDAKTKIRKWF